MPGWVCTHACGSERKYSAPPFFCLILQVELTQQGHTVPTDTHLRAQQGIHTDLTLVFTYMCTGKPAGGNLLHPHVRTHRNGIYKTRSQSEPVCLFGKILFWFFVFHHCIDFSQPVLELHKIWP